MKLWHVVVIGMLLFFLALFQIITHSKVAGLGAYTPANPAGFLGGVWHGAIAPVTFPWRWFNANVRLYESNNTGWWYDFGFFLAIVTEWSIGSSASRKRS